MSGGLHRGGVAALGVSVAAHFGLWVWASGADDDRTAAVAATASFGIVALAGLRSLRLHPLSPAMLYLWALAAFHLGLAAPWALGLESGQTPLWLLTHRLDDALALLIVAFGCYQAGLAAAAWRRSARARSAGAPSLHNTVMYRCGLAVALAGVALLVAGAWMIGLERLAQATYFESYRLTQIYDPRLFISSLQVFPMGLYLAAASAPARRMPWVAALGLAWSLAVFVLGYRGFALTPAATMLAVLHKRGFRLPRAVWAAGLASLLVAVPAARSLRDNPLAERSLTDIALDIHLLEAAEEVGGSLRPLVHTLDLMENEPFRWGYTYWQAVEMVLPNLSIEWDAGGYIPVEKLPPSLWMARLAAPWHYYHGGGLGFSAVAEPYMNFGIAGVAAFFALLAGALVWCDRLDGLRPARVAVWAMALGPLLWTARNAFTVFVRPAVWGALLVLAAYLLSRAAFDLVRSRRPLRPAPALSRGVSTL
jgi:hypothetical protein